MADNAPVIEQPRSPQFPGMKNATDEMGELGKLFSINPLPPEQPVPKAPPTPEPPKTAVQPQPAAPAVEPSAEEDEKFLSGTEMPRQKTDWDKRREAEARRLKRVNDQVAKLSQELETARKAQPIAKIEDDDRFKAIAKERDDFSERLRTIDVERHPKFKAFYDGKINQQIGMAKTIVGADNAERVATILNMPDSAYKDQQLEELIGGLSPIQTSRLGGVVNALAAIQADRTAQIDQAKADFDRMQTENKTKAETESKTRQQKAEELFNTTVKAMGEGENAVDVFKSKDGDEVHNKAVNDRVAYAKGLLFGDTKPDQIVRAALSAAALPGLIKSNQVALARIAELEAQVKSMTAAQPTLKGGGGDGNPKPPKNENQDPLKNRGMIRNTKADAADFVKETFVEGWDQK